MKRRLACLALLLPLIPIAAVCYVYVGVVMLVGFVSGRRVE